MYKYLCFSTYMYLDLVKIPLKVSSWLIKYSVRLGHINNLLLLKVGSMVIMAIYIDNLTELVTVSVQCCDPGFSCGSCRWWCLWCWLVSGMQVWCAGGVVRRWCGVVWCQCLCSCVCPLSTNLGTGSLAGSSLSVSVHAGLDWEWPLVVSPPPRMWAVQPSLSTALCHAHRPLQPPPVLLASYWSSPSEREREWRVLSGPSWRTTG